ncbi:hypothetical protein HDU93_006221, partial [Gonapodya sp. JEL0774]
MSHPQPTNHQPNNTTDPDPVHPSSTSSSPFTVESTDLERLFDPKNVDLLLSRFGGLQGLLKELQVNPERGLDGEDREDDATGEGVGREQDVEERGETVLSPARRRQLFGENRLPGVKPKSIFVLMLEAFKDKILILLSVAAIVSLAVGLFQDFGPTAKDNGEPKTHWIEGVAIIIAVIIVVLTGSINDWQKEKQFRKLSDKKDERQIKVIRGGETVLISVFDLVVGDICLLEPGDVPPADGVLIQGDQIRCDESAATGESDAVRKDVVLGPALNAQGGAKKVDPFLLSGSKVLEGTGKFVVCAVGTNSYFGRTMMGLRTPQEETPLQVKLDLLAERIAKIGATIAVLIFVVLFIKYCITVATREGFGQDCAVDECATEAVARLVSVIVTSITIIVVAVPEGLPLAVTLSLAYGTTRMLKDNNLVRVLSACETMGGATTVCSDKTGTLTQNRMTVVAGTIGQTLSFSGDEEIARLAIDATPASSSSPASSFSVQSFMQILVEGVNLNSTVFEGKNEKTGALEFVGTCIHSAYMSHRTILHLIFYVSSRREGSKTETALVDWIAKFTPAGTYRSSRAASHLKTVANFPFSSERKCMAVAIKIDNSLHPYRKADGKSFYRVYVKGASEIVLSFCDKIATLDSASSTFSISTLDSSASAQVNATINNYAEQSLRTIGMAYRDLSEEEFEVLVSGTIIPVFKSKQEADQVAGNDDFRKDALGSDVGFENLAKKHCTLLGVVGIEDPLRPGVPEAVQSCKDAGVTVRMVTGDNIVTAKAIANKCGILSPGGLAMEGSDFRVLSQAEMDKIIPSLRVLARSSPLDKQILVTRLKALGETVAVTGDGTNDGPALKAADVGFSMGIAGTEVAKEASSIVLMDDNFTSIVKAIMWGRAVNDAVKKFLQFQLTVNVTAVLVTFISAMSDGSESSALTATQLLWVNLIMDSLASLALATEAPTPDLLQRPPERKSDPLISITMWKMILGQALYQVVASMVILYAGPQIFSYQNLLAAGGLTADLRNVSPPANWPLQGQLWRDALKDESTQLRATVFNTFVFMQVFNMINARRKDNNINVFSNIHTNYYMMVILPSVVLLQVLIVQFGGIA